MKLTHSLTQEFDKVHVQLRANGAIDKSRGMEGGPYLEIEALVCICPVTVSASPTAIVFDGVKPSLRAEIEIGDNGKCSHHRKFTETLYLAKQEHTVRNALETIDKKSGWQSLTRYFPKYVNYDKEERLSQLLVLWNISQLTGKINSELGKGPFEKAQYRMEVNLAASPPVTFLGVDLSR